MKLYVKAVSIVAYAMSWMGVFAIVAMMLLTCADVTLRYFGYPIRGAYDITRVLGSVVFSLPIAYSFIKGYQIAVDSIFNRAPRFLRMVADTMICLFSVFITAIISWRATHLGHDLYVRGRVTDTVPIPLWPFVYVMVISFAVYCLVIVAGHLSSLKKEVPKSGQERAVISEN